MKWDAGLYDSKHDFVATYGEDVVTLLNAIPGEYILDASCGTGTLTALIAASGAHVQGIDFSEEMIRQAKEKFPALRFEVASITEFEQPDAYNAIFSNATLHWVIEKEKAIEKFYKNLTPGGRLVLEMGGKNNVRAIITAIREALNQQGLNERIQAQQWYFPSIGEYASLLEQQGFDVEYALHFARPTELKSTKNGIKDWISMFGKSFLEGLDASTREILLENIQQSLKKELMIDGKWYADYKRLRIIARKA